MYTLVYHLKSEMSEIKKLKMYLTKQNLNVSEKILNIRACSVPVRCAANLRSNKIRGLQ